MKKKNAFQLLLIITFLLVSAAFGYLIVKEALLIGKQTVEIDSIEALIEEQQVLLQRMKDAEARSEELEVHLATLQKMIPEDPEQNRFLIWIQQVSSDASLKLSDVSFSEHTIEEGYVEMPVQLSLQGNYKNMLKFLSNLMYGERLVRVDDIDLSESGGNLSVDIKINLFYKSTDKALTTTAEG